ncbi:hypothetical protein Hamer_G011565 [Homarus americanus]|uniref:Uncharacterized protein n=1 Tax=Homarus americanus TaxID=6706 RepID=A0A8J5MZ85_HOMAM|nr:hypothetical protein Hamer_G011565 [Homarus americanus]
MKAIMLEFGVFSLSDSSHHHHPTGCLALTEVSNQQ